MDEEHGRYQTVVKGTPLHRDLMAQMLVTDMALSDVKVPIMCVHEIRALLEILEQPQPDAEDALFTDSKGTMGIPVSFNGMDLAGYVIWMSGEAHFVPSVLPRDPKVVEGMQVLLGLLGQ